MEDAIYCFGAWGFSVSRDGGQSWGGETIGGVQYAFNLLHAKGGGYFPIVRCWEQTRSSPTRSR